MSEPDVLFTVRNSFFLGSYQNVINEAADIENLSDAGMVEKDYYVYRSYLEMGEYDLVINEIPDSAAMALQAVKLLAKYLVGKTAPDAAVSTIAEWLEDPACSGNATVLLIAGMIYAREENYIDALKCCHTGVTLEMMALSVQIYLLMNRPDQAEKQLKAMSALDDDATITQLATAWVDLALGGGKVQEASYIFQELGDKFSWTVRLHNGLAAAHMKMGNWEEAERELLDAYGKNPKDADTMANLYVVGTQLGKNVTRYLTQLKTSSASHPFVKRLDAAEKAFDAAASAGY